MTREEAYYGKIKLLIGQKNFFDIWLDTFIDNEDPLSDIVLELIDCRGDINRAIRCLNLYCIQKPFDEPGVYERLRLELRDEYFQNKKSKDEAVTSLYSISQIIPCCEFKDRCAILSDYYSLAQSGIIDMEKYDRVLKKFLEEGGDIYTKEIWKNQKKQINIIKKLTDYIRRIVWKTHRT